VSLQDLIERVPGGLGEMRRPLLSASAETLLSASSRPAEAVAGDSEASIEADEFDVDEVGGGDDPATAEPVSEEYAFDSFIDATPTQMAGTSSNADDETEAIMRLDLDAESTATPLWSAAGDDPLIVGDELQ
jgi:hypothetical protein